MGDSSLKSVIADFEGRGIDEIAAASVYDAIRLSAQKFPAKIAIVDLPDGQLGTIPQTICYADLHQATVRHANHLLALGLKEGDRILYLAETSLDALIGYWTAQLLGVVVPVNPFLDQKTIVDICRATGARAVMSGGKNDAYGTYARAAALAGEVSGLDLHIVLSGEADGDAVRLAGTPAASADGFMGRLPGLDDCAAFFPTGGTTGAPKVARLTHRNILVGSYSSAIASSTDADEVVPLGLPIFHAGGGVVASTRTLILGQTVVILTPSGFRSPDLLANFWDLAERYGFTQLIGVPTIFSDLLKTYPGRGTPIRRFIAGAGKLPASLCLAYEERLGIGIHEGYGMTETSGFCVVNPTALSPRPGSGGIPAPFYKIKVVVLDADGRHLRDCANGETGNIAVAGPGVFQGYVDPDQDETKFIKGLGEREWIDTGDLGRFDEDGYLWITGREKDLIIRGGHNIDPAPIEEALLEHPDIADAAAVGMPDARVGELPVAFVRMEDGATLDEAAIRAFCLDRLPERAATPVRIFALDVLPRTAMQKIFKPELRRLAASAAIGTAMRDHGLSHVDQWEVKADQKGCLSVQVAHGALSTQDEAALLEILGPLNILINFCETI